VLDAVGGTERGLVSPECWPARSEADAEVCFEEVIGLAARAASMVSSIRDVGRPLGCEEDRGPCMFDLRHGAIFKYPSSS
jgi:hypothetical protein